MGFRFYASLANLLGLGRCAVRFSWRIGIVVRKVLSIELGRIGVTVIRLMT